MSYWSVYVSEGDEKILKKKIQQIADKRRWSFSQAVSGLLREYLIDHAGGSDEKNWQTQAAEAFFKGYPDEDSIYDSL